MRALIIDDHEPSRAALARLLTRLWTIEIEPLEVMQAGTLAEGLLVADSANVTILDLNLPDSTVEETIEAIKHFQPPVIVLTGDENGKEQAARCLNAGAAHVYLKGSPVGIEALLSGVFAAMRRDLLRRHHIDSAAEPHQEHERHHVG